MAVSRVGNSHTFQVTMPSDREIALTRLFDAPRQLVFDATPAFYGTHLEIAPPERLVYTEIFEPYADGEPSVVTTILTEDDGRTRLTVTASYESLDVRDMVLKTGMEKGAATSYDRLEDVVREMQG